VFERLEGAERVTLLSAAAGSGKTVVLRSWFREMGMAGNVAWVWVQGEERDPQRFMLSLLDALRGTVAGTRVRELTTEPDPDGSATVERLLEDLASLEERVWLVIDDLHQLRASEALRQVESLLMRAPRELRVVLSTRHDVRLGLHRLRVEGELTEIRGADLRFTREEARALLVAAGVQVTDSALALLHERTEGWASGLRLAALALAGHPDPEQFAAEFSGSERTVAEYLLAEVLERQPPEVRRLLLRTSVLERLSGSLAEALTGSSGTERILQELEEANAFVVSLDARRTWFRYHRLFADLLQLELRRTAPEELPALHRAAAEWYSEHEYPIEAVRHAQAAEHWDLAARLLSDHSFPPELNGHATTVHELLAGFPSRVVAADPELTALTAAKSTRESLREAERYLALASHGLASVRPDRRGHLRVLLAVVRLWIAHLRGDLPTTVQEAEQLLTPAEPLDAAPLGLGEDLRVLALLFLGIAELWHVQLEPADRHLERAVSLARRIDRPFLEVNGLAHWAILAGLRSGALGAQHAMEAIELARQRGWTEEPIAGVAYLALAGPRLWQGRLDEAETWLEHAERTLPASFRAEGVLLLATRGVLELARGREEAALAAFVEADRRGALLTAPHPLASTARALLLGALLRLHQLERVEHSIGQLEECDRERPEIRVVLAHLRVTRGDPQSASVLLAPVLESSDPNQLPVVLIQALLLEAIARDGIGDAGAAEQALERALDLSEPDGLLLPFLLYPTPRLLQRHSRYRTAHASLISEILSVQAGRPPSTREEHGRRPEPLSDSETRILRYLPTNLSRQEIAGELDLSVNTVKAHIRHIYAKLGAHRRDEAVQRARALGLLAPSAFRRHTGG
jgi:LuxR family maltose regulon positive regulatory protein